MRKVLVVLVVLLIAGAFVAGYWPQRERLIEAQAETVEARRQLAEARTELDEAEAKARLGRLFGQFLALEDAVAGLRLRRGTGPLLVVLRRGARGGGQDRRRRRSAPRSTPP